MNITFVTGNQAKADYLARYLDMPISHTKLDLDELQSLDLKVIVEHKARQAYAKVGQPVLVEDVALEFTAMGKLPGTFIRFFLQEMSPEALCALVDGKPRDAVARCVFGYYDGTRLEFFEGHLDGQVAPTPAGQNGYGWDRIFIPEGYSVTRAELSEADDQKTYLRIKPLEQIKQFLQNIEA